LKSLRTAEDVFSFGIASVTFPAGTLWSSGPIQVSLNISCVETAPHVDPRLDIGVRDGRRAERPQPSFGCPTTANDTRIATVGPQGLEDDERESQETAVEVAESAAAASLREHL
jgi:hypothetical protein